MARAARIAILFASTLSFAPQAMAQSCTVSGDPVLFDPYDPLGAAPSDGVGTVRLRCDGAVPVSVGLGTGAGGAGRALQGAEGELRYELYSDPGRLLAWGDGTGAPARAATGPEADLNVYGRIAPGQNARGGDYSDLVTIILSF